MGRAWENFVLRAGAGDMNHRAKKNEKKTRAQGTCSRGLAYYEL
jgi:hypothetical protein